jgi:sensor c-di-GMP phosphodiesterase-like protein
MWIVPFGILLGAIFSILAFLLARQQTGMLAKLDRAVRRKELFLVYMPIVELSSGKWVGAEALLRWRQRSGEVIGPDVFVPIAERHHRIKKLTSTALEQLVADSRHHLAEYADDMYISINLTAADLSDPASVENVCRASAAAGVPSIMVEATEGALLHVERVKSHIRQLRDLGIRVAIDDFGTGYSSLSYLSSLEVDCIKIDKSFVSSIGTASVTDHVVRHIIEMAKDLGLGLIAEGVETREQADYLIEQGVKYAQGWLFGKPMPVHEFVRNRNEVNMAAAMPMTKTG